MLFDIGGYLEGIMRFVYQFGGREVQNKQTAITIWYKGGCYDL
jgi:hypothetical protein